MAEPVSNVAPSIGLDFEAAALVTLDAGGAVTRISAAARALLDLSPEQPCPEEIAKLLREPSAPRVGDWGLHILPGPQGRRMSMVTLPLTNGGKVLLLHDVSDAQASLRRHLHRYRLETLDRMASMFAPELASPLASLLINAELLEREGGTQAELIDDIRAACERVRAIVEDLTSLRGKLEPDIVSLHDVATLAWMRLTPASLTEGCQFQLSIEEGAELVRVHPHMLDQILTSLLINALESSPGPTRLRIEASVGGRAPEWPMVQLRVSDDGPGVAPEIRGHLFEPFVSTKEKHLGLGLTLAREMIRDLGGELLLEPMSPSTFSLFVPAATTL